MCPVVIYPKDKITKVAKLVKDAEEETAKQTAFESVEDMFADMGIDIENV